MPTDFDERAATWDDDPAKVERARIAAAANRKVADLTPATRVLELGAGTGLLSQELRADIGPLTLVDPSSGMREVLQAKIDHGALVGATIWDIDLGEAPIGDARFDLVITMLAFHHIPNLQPTLNALARLLGDGGLLCAIDLEKEDGSFHGPDFDGHEGFDREELTTMLRSAGFGPTTFEHCFVVEKNGLDFDAFLATTRTVTGATS